MVMTVGEQLKEPLNNFPLGISAKSLLNQRFLRMFDAEVVKVGHIEHVVAPPAVHCLTVHV